MLSLMDQMQWIKLEDTKSIVYKLYITMQIVRRKVSKNPLNKDRFMKLKPDNGRWTGYDLELKDKSETDIELSILFLSKLSD